MCGTVILKAGDAFFAGHDNTVSLGRTNFRILATHIAYHIMLGPYVG